MRRCTGRCGCSPALARRSGHWRRGSRSAWDGASRRRSRPSPVRSRRSGAASPSRRSRPRCPRRTGSASPSQRPRPGCASANRRCASEARHRQIVESSTDYAIITTDLDGQITGWNAGARHLLGWREAEALGQNRRLIYTPEDREAGAPEAKMQLALAKGRAADERWHVRKDGSRFWSSGALLPLRGDAGATIGFLKILRDRTTEREAEDALRRLNATLEECVARRTSDLTAAAADRERVED